MTTLAPTKKLAFRLDRGDVIRHGYRITSVVPT